MQKQVSIMSNKVDVGDESIKKVTKGPMQRMLMVIEAIALEGPITLYGLCDVLPISRSAIWRAGDVLIRSGWVRRRIFDGAYEISSKIDYMMADTYFTHRCIDLALPKVTDLIANGAKVVQIAMFVNVGEFAIVDSNSKEDNIGKPLSLVFDPKALLAQTYLDPASLTRHMGAYLRTASSIEREYVMSGSFKTSLSNISLNTDDIQNVLRIKGQDDEVFVFWE